MRPGWVRYFMDAARLASTRATCPRKHVGAVIVLDKRIICTGYNGSPPGASHCEDDGCLMLDDHCIRTIHAEANAILQAAQSGVSVKGATLFCTWPPCHYCARLIVGAGIAAVYFEGEPLTPEAERVFRECGTEITYY